MTKVAFAGLGRMGAPMAVNLAEAGFDLLLWNRTTEKAEQLAGDIGAQVSARPRDLTEECDVVVTMLADDDASEQVHHGDEGLFEATAGAACFIEMGTMSPSHIRELAKRRPNRMVVDAPVSGSIEAARNATLLVLAGATAEVAEPVEPVLEAMSRKIVYLGDVGAGATMKLAINLVIHGLNQTFAEAMTLAEAAGIATSDAYEAMEESAAAAPMLTYRKPHYLDERANPVSFALSLARKDVSLAIDLATELGVSMPQTALNLDQLQKAEASGLGERDMAAMLDYMRGAG